MPVIIRVVLILLVIATAQPTVAGEATRHQKQSDNLWDATPTEINQAYFEKRYASMKDMQNKPSKHNHSAEIKSFTAECYIQEKEEKCRIDHNEFGAAYIYAFRGNYQAQRNVAFYLSQGSEGINQNKIQGCAWRIVILTSGDHHVDDIDTSSHKTECGKLSPVEHNAARVRAAEVAEEIYGNRYIPAEF